MKDYRKIMINDLKVRNQEVLRCLEDSFLHTKNPLTNSGRYDSELRLVFR